MAGDAEGTPFGRYRLIARLGQGGMGEVWRAYDTATDRVVALKMLLPHFAQDKTFEQRFRREARAVARLEDPHVVPVHDVGEIEGRLYVTMRLINGHDLQTLLDGGPLLPQQAVGIVEQIAAALHVAHKSGVVHRDVKPSNVLLTEDDFAYLIDFGIARAAGDTGITATGATIGTWAYMAPERFRSGEVEPGSDIYALTCVLYECLTGLKPFPGNTFEQLALAHLVDPPPMPSGKRDVIPPAMDEVIGRGLAKDPAQRYRTTTELAAAARATLTTQSDPRPLVPDPPPPAATTQQATNAADTGSQPAGPRTTPTSAAEQRPAPPATMPANSVAPDPDPTWAVGQRAPAQHPALTETVAAPAPVLPARRRRKALILIALGMTVATAIAIVTLVVANRHQPQMSTSDVVTPGFDQGKCKTAADADKYVQCRVIATGNSLDAVWHQLMPRYTKPHVQLFTNQVNTGCGAATSAVGPFYCPVDKTAYFDTDFLQVLVDKFGSSGGPFAQEYVVAHEYGHHVQNLQGTLGRSQQGAQGSQGNGVRTELQADCYAGIWAHYASTVKQESTGVPYLQPLTDKDIQDALAAVASVADDRLPANANNPPESWSHGSSEQRQKWFTIGYQSGVPDKCDTFAVSDLG